MVLPKVLQGLRGDVPGVEVARGHLRLFLVCFGTLINMVLFRLPGVWRVERCIQIKSKLGRAFLIEGLALAAAKVEGVWRHLSKILFRCTDYCLEERS